MANADPTPTPLPIACTLRPLDMADRRAEWQRLIASALIDKEPTGRGVRLRFGALDGAGEQLRELVALERECCAFATWSVDDTGEEIVLDVAASGEGAGALRAMFEVG